VPKDLAALLAEDGAVPADVVERALARQQEAGGTLDTALLELGAIREDVLAAALARAAELPQAPAAAWRASDARARRVFPSRVAERHGLAPFALDGRELSLVATYPVDLGLLDEISFMLSLHLTAHVGPEWRVRELIHRIYGTPLSPRLAAIAAAVRASGTDDAPPPAPAPEARAEAEAPEPAGDGAEDARVADPSRAAEASPHDASGEPAPRRAPPVLSFGGFGTSDEPMEPLAAALAEALESVDLSEYEDAPSPEEAASQVEGPAAGGEGAPDALAPEEPPPEEPAAPLDRSAPPRWTLADARAAAGAADHRDAVVLTALRYARDFFEFAAMFAVTRDAVAGHDALGDEEARDRTRAVAIWANDPGVFRTVIETQSPYLGPVQASAAGTETVLKGLGRTPRTVLVYPIVLRGRPVCILYADNGEAPVSARRLGDLLLFLSTVGATFERIIRDRKKRGRRRTRPASGAPEADARVTAGDAASAEQRAGPAARQGSAPEPTSATTHEELAPAAPAPPAEATAARVAAPAEEARAAPAAVAESTKEERVSPPPAAAATEEAPPSSAPVAATREEAPPSPAPVAVTREEEPASPAPVAAATQAHRAAARVEAAPSAAGHEPGRGPDGAPPERREEVPVDDAGAGPRPEREPDADEGHVSFAHLEAAGELEQPAPAPASPDREPPRAVVPPPPPQQVAPRAPLPPRKPAASPAHRVPSPTDPGRTAIIWPAAVPAGGAEADPWEVAEQAARAAPPAPRSAFPGAGASPVPPADAPRSSPPSQAAPASSAAPSPPAAPPPAAAVAAPPPVHAARRAAAPAAATAAPPTEPTPAASPPWGEATPAAHAPTPGERTPPVAPPPDPGSLAALADRALDADPEVAATACAALGSRRRDPALRPAADKLRRALLSGIAARAQRAARGLAALRDPEAIPLLIQVLETSDPETASAAAAALSAVTLQRLGPDARRWLAWWKENRGRGRAQWLFAALTSPERELRVAASLELSQAAPSPVVYTADMPAPEREKAARTWAGWWARSGHVL
jgi:hypothetical protein